MTMFQGRIQDLAQGGRISQKYTMRAAPKNTAQSAVKNFAINTLAGAKYKVVQLTTKPQYIFSS